MPVAHYAAQWQRGELTGQDIESAIAEIDWPQGIDVPNPQQVIDEILAGSKSSQSATTGAPVRPSVELDRPIRTMAEQASAGSRINWVEIVRDEVSKFCAAHYDDGQAGWTSPWKDLSLYEAWRNAAMFDRNIEVLGLTGMRKFVAELPDDPQSALIDLLTRMKVPYALWSAVLLCQAFSIPGWSAWAKYQDRQGELDDSGSDALASLLAMRLAYDVAIAESQGIEVEWSIHLKDGLACFRPAADESLRQIWTRYVLLRAAEIHYRNELISKLTRPIAPLPETKDALAQMVFCIDVRSERIRRHLETLTPDIETFGFAGFFGVPMEFVALGESEAVPQLPVLLQPQLQIKEELRNADDQLIKTIIDGRRATRTWRKCWRGFQTAASGCFAFVELAGLFAGLRLVRNSIFTSLFRSSHQHDGLKSHNVTIEPTLQCSGNADSCVLDQVNLAERVLRNIGLTSDFARLVVLCGHQSQTCNNPLAAGLDCGACGGHSGAPNALWIASLLNRTAVRQGLVDRGIAIPKDTQFVAAVHNTTTDAIEFLNAESIDSERSSDLERLKVLCEEASQRTVEERQPKLSGNSPSDLLRRALDWSEVRPEWGLAGNRAFIAAPRSMSRQLNLDGATFLHSYEHKNDTDGSILETIMTAPMVVANWINMQYYASSVDNQHFGSGNKTLHNVVGRFGLLSGNAGDLQTGLPWQSVHDGQEFVHQPMRLTVVIAAPRSAIDHVCQKHDLVSNLVSNEWLHIIAIEEGQAYRLITDGQWASLEPTA